jgi:hypothetical protein
MPKYAISLLHNPGEEPGSGIEPEERQFANLGEALQRGREMYRAHESSAIGFRICDALGKVIHEWKRWCRAALKARSARRRDRHSVICGLEDSMDEDRFNMDIRKFLKVVGATSQREIELAVREAIAKGTLGGNTVLKPRMTLRIPEVGLEHVIDGEIDLGWTAIHQGFLAEVKFLRPHKAARIRDGVILSVQKATHSDRPC